jgi:flagellar basal-body rod protein FlgC
MCLEMATERIILSGLTAHARTFEHAAHNIAQFGVQNPMLVRTRLVSEGVAGRPGGVRAEGEVVTPQRGSVGSPSGPVLDPRVAETFDQIDLGRELADMLVARRGFQASVAAQRAARAFMEATLSLAA